MTIKTICPFCKNASEHVEAWEVQRTPAGIPVYSRRVFPQTGDPLRPGKQPFFIGHDGKPVVEQNDGTQEN